ncbi:MAG: hypothetical protein Q4C42_09320 [Clostridia bacterium]|nr:hypothetical protein [Clostridia bacterium]
MKKIISFLLFLAVSVSLTACKSEEVSFSKVEKSEAEVIATEQEQVTKAPVVSTADVEKEYTITTDSVYNGRSFEFSEIPFTTGLDDILSKLGVSSASASSDDEHVYIDSVVFKMNGYNFYPYVVMWNSGAKIVYLCASEDNNSDLTNFKSDFLSVFAKYGDSETNQGAEMWTIASSRLWCGVTVEYPGHGTCKAIEIQKVAA